MSSWRQPPYDGLQPDALALSLGFTDWNFNPFTCAGGGVLTSQTAYAMAVYIPKGTITSGCAMQVSTVGAGTAPTGFFVGIASTTTMLAQSADLHASAQLTTGGKGQFPFTAPLVIPASGIYYRIVLLNGAFGTTNVQFARGGTGSVGGLTTPLAGQNPFCGTIGTGITALPANGQPIAVTLTSAASFFIGGY